MSGNVHQQPRPTGFSESNCVRNSTAQNISAEIDKLCEDFENMHINDCSSEDRHLADTQVGSSRQTQEFYRGNYQLKVESAHSSHAAAQPKIQTQSIQEPMLDMSKHINVDCQKIVSFEHKTEAHEGPVTNTIHANNIDTLNQTINMAIGTVSNRDDIKIDYCPVPVSEFSGRQEELEELERMFEDRQVIAVVGMGGVGKSQLARKYAQQYKNRYQYRFWTEVDTTEKLDSSFQELADKLDIKATGKDIRVNDIYKAFTRGRALLILDNVASPEPVYEYLPTRFQLADVTVHVLITSRWTDWTTIREMSMVLHPFKAEVSLNLLQILIENETVQTDEQNWKELANTMGHLPLALRLSSSFIRKQQKYNSKFKIKDYITDFNTRVDKLLTKTTPDYGNNRSIYVTTAMTLASLGKKSKKLVNAAAYFNSEKILHSDLVPLIPKAYDLAVALADVINYSLFHDEGTDRFSMHRLIQTSVQLYQKKKKKDKRYYSLTLEYALKHSQSNQCDTVFTYANRYKTLIVQIYKREKHDRSVILKFLLRNRGIDVLKIIFENFRDDINKYDAIYLAIESECADMFAFALSYVVNERDLVFYLFDQACEKDNKFIVHFLLENRFISVTELYDDNQTLLHRAACHASSAIVSLILELNNAVIDVQDMDGNTALHTVIQSYNKILDRSLMFDLTNEISESQIIETARVLIDNGASVVIRNGVGYTSLHCAILYKAAELVSLICQSDNTVVNIVGKDGRTALHCLCMDYPYGSEERVIDIAHVLIKNGASVVIRDKAGYTPLHYAILFKAVELVSLICQTDNTVVNIVGKDGRTALYCLCMDYSYGSEERDIDIAHVLIKNGASVVIRDKAGYTPLHYAILFKTVELVSLICQTGNTVVNIVDIDGRTVLHRLCRHHPYASEERVIDIAHVLIKNGASVVARDSADRTALHSAASYAHAPLVSLLIQSNKEVIDMVENRRNTALHLVASDYYREENTTCVEQTISILIKNGLSIHTLNSDGQSPLDTISYKYKQLLRKLADEHEKSSCISNNGTM